MGRNSDLNPHAAARAARRREIAARDRAIAEFAATQHGAFTREQAHGCGFSDRDISDRANRTFWPIARDVYALGHPGLSRRGRARAALLTMGPESALSHDTAARLWEMVGRSTEGPIHVSVMDRNNTRVAPVGVRKHRPRSLTAADLASHRGSRLTTPERTLIDLLPDRSMVEITRMLEQMVTVLNRSPDDLHAWGHQLSGVGGKPKLIRALDEVAGPAVIRSEFEALFRSVCQEGGLPPAVTNYRLGRWEIDAIYLEHGVAVELDSWRFHGGRWQFHKDRRKGLAISRAGFELIRLSWPQLKHDRAEVVEALKYALARGANRSAFTTAAAPRGR